MAGPTCLVTSTPLLALPLIEVKALLPPCVVPFFGGMLAFGFGGFKLQP